MVMKCGELKWSHTENPALGPKSGKGSAVLPGLCRAQRLPVYPSRSYSLSAVGILFGCDLFTLIMSTKPNCAVKQQKKN